MSSRRGTSPALPRASDCRPPDSAHIRGGRGIQAQLLCRAGLGLLLQPFVPRRPPPGSEPVIPAGFPRQVRAASPLTKSLRCSLTFQKSLFFFFFFNFILSGEKEKVQTSFESGRENCLLTPKQKQVFTSASCCSVAELGQVSSLWRLFCTEDAVILPGLPIA